MNYDVAADLIKIDQNFCRGIVLKLLFTITIVEKFVINAPFFFRSESYFL